MSIWVPLLIFMVFVVIAVAFGLVSAIILPKVVRSRPEIKVRLVKDEPPSDAGH